MKHARKSIFIAIVVLALFFPQVLADNDGSASSENRYVFSGDDIVHTGTTNGYSGNDPIEKGDDHYGWKLGDFYVTGFTSYKQDSDGTVVFLKNAGDDVKLSYHLLQDIEKLNDDDDLEIHSDGKAWDEYFKTKTYQKSMGLLVVQKTDYQNVKEEPLVYESFLVGKEKGAETDIHLCEEGDYEVALDYEIEVDGSIIGFIDKDTYEDYRHYFKFKVRNGNCMIFPISLSGKELTNESYSKEGFYIDFARSKYLEINVTYKVLVEGKNGLVEDVRYNRPAADGEKYDQSGIYEISFTNKYTNTTLSKTLYVGDDPSIRMMAIEHMSLEDVNKSLYPEVTETSLVSEVNPADAEKTKKDVKDDEDNGNKMIVIICAIGAVILVAVVSVGVAIAKKKKRTANYVAIEESDDSDPSNDAPVEDEKNAPENTTNLNNLPREKSVNADIDALPYNGRGVHEVPEKEDNEAK